MGYCRECRQPILFATVTNKEGRPPSRMPLDPDPDPAGNVAVYRDETRRLVGRVLGKDARPAGYERLFMPHFATCPKRKEAAPVTPPGVTSLGEWRKARAAHAKGKRNQRGKRPGKPITGYVIQPPQLPGMGES